MRVWTKSVGFQRLADRADAPVHHVRRGDDVRARLGMRQRLLHQHADGFVVQHVAGLIHQTVLAVAGKRVERHVGNHAQFGEMRLERPHRPLRQTFGVIGLLGVQRLCFRRRDRKQRHRRHAQLAQVSACAQQVDAHARYARHRGHRLALVPAFDHEQRLNQIGDRELGLPRQPAREVIAAHPARAGAGKTSGQAWAHDQGFRGKRLAEFTAFGRGANTPLLATGWYFP